MKKLLWAVTKAMCLQPVPCELSTLEPDLPTHTNPLGVPTHMRELTHNQLADHFQSSWLWAAVLVPWTKSRSSGRATSALTADPLLWLQSFPSEVQLHLHSVSHQMMWVIDRSTSVSGQSLMTLATPLMQWTGHWWNCLVPGPCG